ncbi:uncharacterized protein LOC143940028 [Lithobates pipiens]
MNIYSDRITSTTKTTTNETTNLKMRAGRKRRAESPAGDLNEPIARRLRSRAPLEPIVKRTRSKSPEDQSQPQLPPLVPTTKRTRSKSPEDQSQPQLPPLVRTTKRTRSKSPEDQSQCQLPSAAPIVKRIRTKSPEGRCQHQLPTGSTSPSDRSHTPIDSVVYRTRLRSKTPLKDELVLDEEQRIASERRSIHSRQQEGERIGSPVVLGTAETPSDHGSPQEGERTRSPVVSGIAETPSDRGSQQEGERTGSAVVPFTAETPSDRGSQQEGERTGSAVVPFTAETPNDQTTPPTEEPMETDIQWAIASDPETGGAGRWWMAYLHCTENEQPWNLSYDLGAGANGRWRIETPFTEQEMAGSPWSMSFEEEAFRIRFPQPTQSIFTSFEEGREAFARLRARILRRHFKLALCTIS